MNHSKAFLTALKHTLGVEGIYSLLASDPGRETFMGISRRYWPHWPGWKAIDAWDKVSPAPDLFNSIAEFYHGNFWCRFQGDKVAALSEPIAMEVFDTSVNLDVPDGVGCLQRALNMQNDFGRRFPDLVDDGRLGPETLKWLKWYLQSRLGSFSDNEEILLACMNGEQYIIYKNNPKHEAFRGVFRRTQII